MNILNGQPLTEFPAQEIKEELGVALHMKQIFLGNPYQVADATINRI